MVNDPLVGFRNNHLRFAKLLGKGAMGSVYLGQQLGLERKVAIKVINAPLAADATYVERFSREAKSLGKSAIAMLLPVMIRDGKMARMAGFW